MQAGLERKIIRRGLTALLLTGVLLVAGATAAGADSTPISPPPVLARTGSDTGTLLGIGAATAAAGAGMVVFARRRRLAVVPS